MIKNEVRQLYDKKNNQKFLINGGVRLFFNNIFLPNESDKLPMLKAKLRQVLVDFGLSRTHVEINQKLNSLSVYYRDPMAKELHKQCILLLRDSKSKSSQAIELVIDTEGNLVSPNSDGEIKTYSGLTKLLYQEFILEPQVFSLADSSVMKFYADVKETIQKGNLVACVPLSAILTEEVD